MIAQPRVVVATGSTDVGEVLAGMLEGEPWQVLAADTAERAVSLVEKTSPSAMLLDSRLPGVDGFEVCRRLRADRRSRLLPIVMVGCDSLDDRVAALEAGADDLLTRPFEQSELIARLRSLIHVKSLYDRLEETRSVIFALAKAAEAKDFYTLCHAERVADKACAMAQSLGMDAEACDQVRVGALVHDVGKIAVADAILHKPGPLTAEEFDQVKRHPVVGSEIVAPLAAQEQLVAIVRSHHERVDGGGYPDGLRGDEIPIGARIVAICDAFDAMVNVRPYRPARSRAEAVAELKAGGGTQWDARLVDVFVRQVDDDLTTTGLPIDR